MKKWGLIVLSVVIMFGIFKNFRGGSSSEEVKEAISQKAQLVDVRTPMEFASGSAKGAFNMPLDQLERTYSKLKKNQTVVVFCRSGNRSSQAKRILEAHGYEVLNGGSVQDVIALQ